MIHDVTKKVPTTSDAQPHMRPSLRVSSGYGKGVMGTLHREVEKGIGRQAGMHFDRRRPHVHIDFVGRNVRAGVRRLARWRR